jgi:hypothetical protein
MILCKSKIKMAAFVEPTYSKKVLAEFKDKLDEIPVKAQEKLAAKRVIWRRKVDAQGVKILFAQAFKQTQKILDFMDTLYRWTAGPGEFGHPSRRPLLWTGTMNIHSCQNWWVSNICLYMMYPFVHDDLYQGVLGLHEIFQKLFRVPVDTDDLDEWRPTMLAHLKRFTDTVPEMYHGVLVHCIPHVYDFTRKNGAAALLFTMYIFERLVALYNRLINDKRDAEGNLVNNIDSQTALLNTLYSSTTPDSLRAELANVPKSILSSLNMQATDFQEDSGDKESEKKSPTKVPVQPKCTSTVQLPHLPAPHNDILNATIGRLGSLTELHTAMLVNGLQRHRGGERES